VARAEASAECAVPNSVAHTGRTPIRPTHPLSVATPPAAMLAAPPASAPPAASAAAACAAAAAAVSGLRPM